MVANTVQVPIGLDLEDGKEILYRVPDAVNVKQVPGRIVAQVGHVVSLTRMMMVARALELGESLMPNDDAYQDQVWTALMKPITTIVLAAKDSFELHHVYRLLEKRLNTNCLPYSRVHAFHDINEDVYRTDKKVMTAIATEPLPKSETEGILDYLPLWKPEP